MTALVQAAALGVAATVFTALWQGALIAGAVWLVLRALRGTGAATRYAIWLCALVAMVAVPLATVLFAPPVTSAVAEPDPGLTLRQAQGDTSAGAHVASVAEGASPAALDRRAAPDAIAPARVRLAIPARLAAAIALAWLLLAAARLGKLALALRELAVIRRDAAPWSSEHRYPVLVSERVRVPIAFGFVRPAVVLPAALPDEIGAEALRTVLVHESAHLRRLDVWTNALARVAEALLVLDPAAWFVMRRLAAEREIACDDCVVERTGAGDAFAHVLADLALRPGLRAPIAAASATGSPRSTIVTRIEQLLDARPRRLRLSPAALAAALGSLAALALVAGSVAPVLAYATGSSGSPHGAVALAADDTGCTGLRMRIPVSELLSPSAAIARWGAAHVVTFDATLDAAGKPRTVAVGSSPYPAMAARLKNLLEINRFQTSPRNCAPATGTVRSAMLLGGAVRSGAVTDVDPVYPSGWSARHPGACKIPSVVHGPFPAFPSSVTGLPVGAEYTSSVRVQTDASGAASGATITGSSGVRAFDDAVLAAARSATYPLPQTSGFKPVRPSGATLAWNAAHGASTYAHCPAPPGGYVWHTTFSRTTGFALATKRLAAARGNLMWR